MRVELLSVTPDAERIIESAGRTSYLSQSRKQDGSARDFIRMLIKLGHESVLEHASATFRVRGGSRAFTHQLVRHRLCSYTQQSQRHVNEASFEYVEPNSVRTNAEAHVLFSAHINSAKETYARLQQMGISNEDARFVLPNAVVSEIVVTANFRQWRHVLELRGGPEAQWEIRVFALEVLRILKQYAPAVFEDFDVDVATGTIRKSQPG